VKKEVKNLLLVHPLVWEEIRLKILVFLNNKKNRSRGKQKRETLRILSSLLNYPVLVQSEAFCEKEIRPMEKSGLFSKCFKI
jgi:hypothetical protein